MFIVIYNIPKPSNDKSNNDKSNDKLSRKVFFVILDVYDQPNTTQR